MISTVVELAGFAVLAGTAFLWNHTVGGVVAGAELLLIGYAAEGSELDFKGLMTEVHGRRVRRRMERLARRTAKRTTRKAAAQ